MSLRIFLRPGFPAIALRATAFTATRGSAAQTWRLTPPGAPLFSLLIGPGLQGLVSSAAKPDEQGAVRGGLQSLGGIATVIGPLLYGGVFAWSLSIESSVDLTGLAVLISSACMVVAFFIARKFSGSERVENAPVAA